MDRSTIHNLVTLLIYLSITFGNVYCQIEYQNNNQNFYHEVTGNSKKSYDYDSESLDHLFSSVQDNLREALNSGDTQNLLKTLIGDGQLGNVSEECIQSTVKLFEDLFQPKPRYAPEVIDSIAKLPSGILQGHVAWLGAYDQCLDIDVKEGNQTVFKADYCSLALNASIIPTADIRIGVCVPDTCSYTDLINLSNIALKALNVSSMKVDYGMCNKDLTNRKFSAGDITAVVILGIIGFLLLIGTLYDIISYYRHEWREPDTDHDLLIPPSPEDGAQSGLINVQDDDDLIVQTVEEVYTKPAKNTEDRKHGVLGSVLMCFSVIHNGTKILSTEQRSGQLSSLNGMRVISMWWVILGHSHLFVTYYADNGLEAYKIIARTSFNVVLNGTYSVDTFFFLSGLLVCYLTIKELRSSDDRRQCFNWGLFYFHRFWRLTPMYALLIMIYTTVYSYIPGGPVYVSIVGVTPNVVQNPCVKYWWTNLLYINNFIPEKLNGQCFAWGWYLANDMQFYVVSPIILFALHRKRVVGLAMVGILIITCTLTRGILAHVYNISPVATDTTNAGSGADIYEKPYTRIHVYLVGILVGYVLCTRVRTIKIHRVLLVIGWIVAISTGLAVIYGLRDYYNGTRQATHAAGVIYETFGRLAWAMALAWVALVCCTGNCAPVNAILGWKAWAPLSRLTYGAYLIHPMVMFAVLLRRETLVHYSDLGMVYIYIGNLVLSYLAAFLASVAFEGPFMALEKVIFKRKRD